MRRHNQQPIITPPSAANIIPSRKKGRNQSGGQHVRPLAKFAPFVTSSRRKVLLRLHHATSRVNVATDMSQTILVLTVVSKIASWPYNIGVVTGMVYENLVTPSSSIIDQ